MAPATVGEVPAFACEEGRSKRIVFLDLARGLAIAFMVMQHAVIVYETGAIRRRCCGARETMFSFPCFLVFLSSRGSSFRLVARVLGLGRAVEALARARTPLFLEPERDGRLFRPVGPHRLGDSALGLQPLRQPPSTGHGWCCAASGPSDCQGLRRATGKLIGVGTTDADVRGYRGA